MIDEDLIKFCNAVLDGRIKERRGTIESFGNFFDYVKQNNKELVIFERDGKRWYRLFDKN